MPKRKSSNTQHDPYLDFLRTVHLSGMGIDDAHFKIDREVLSKSKASLSAVMQGEQTILRHDDGFFVVGADFKVELKKAKSTNAGHVFCKYSALFSLDCKAPVEFVHRFAANEARLIFWPYARQFIADSTYRMAISPVTLPLTSDVKFRLQSSTKLAGKKV